MSTFEQQPGEPRSENDADKVKEPEASSFRNKVRKQLITGAILGASVIGGVTGAVYEAKKTDSDPTVKATEKSQAERFAGSVSEKITVPGHVQTIPTMVGKSMGVVPAMIPDAYSLRISTESGDRLVSVDKNVFDSVHVGDRIESADNGKTIIREKQEQ
jgi:hypothetical protein